MEIKVVLYDDSLEMVWDNFIREEACNATFLQSRRFVNYHPQDRYEDYSLLFYNKERLVGVCLGAVKNENGDIIFYSHPGTTYGGIVVSKEMLRTEKILALLDVFENHLKSNGFSKCILKQNNPLMNFVNTDLLDFCMYFRKYHEYEELNLFIDYEDYNMLNTISNFSKMRKRQVKKCMDYGIKVKELGEREEMQEFIDVLAKNLKKYRVSPYHTVDDLLDLKKRFPEEIQFWGAIYNDKIVAETMVFIFNRVKCIQTHYLASDPDFDICSPMAYMYYSVIELYKSEGYKKISWGITTEHLGLDINYNLTNTKEEFGSKHSIVRIYEKEI